MRMEPAISLPISRGTSPAASAAAAPPEGTTHGSFWIPWVPGQAVDVVVALEVTCEQWKVGLAQDDGAGFGEALHGQGARVPARDSGTPAIRRW